MTRRLAPIFDPDAIVHVRETFYCWFGHLPDDVTISGRDADLLASDSILFGTAFLLPTGEPCPTHRRVDPNTVSASCDGHRMDTEPAA